MTRIERFCGCLADDCSQQPSSKLEQQKLGFSPGADRIALIRRAHFDLLGLPPSPEGDYRVRREFVSASLGTRD